MGLLRNAFAPACRNGFSVPVRASAVMTIMCVLCVVLRCGTAVSFSSFRITLKP